MLSHISRTIPNLSPTPPVARQVYVQMLYDAQCRYAVLGCMSPVAFNYEANATIDDGSCVILSPPPSPPPPLKPPMSPP
eukprot:7336292-Prymnesium_polylepis.1